MKPLSYVDRPRTPFQAWLARVICLWRSGAIAVALLLPLLGCADERGSAPSRASKLGFKIPSVDGGRPEQGRQLIFAYGCGMCHVIPGIPGARNHIGPPLDGIAVRGYIGGVVVNLPENLIQFVMDPPAHNPNTAMPNLGVTHDQARHIAAYLYTLQ